MRNSIVLKFGTTVNNPRTNWKKKYRTTPEVQQSHEVLLQCDQWPWSSKHKHLITIPGNIISTQSAVIKWNIKLHPFLWDTEELDSRNLNTNILMTSSEEVSVRIFARLYSTVILRGSKSYEKHVTGIGTERAFWRSE